MLYWVRGAQCQMVEWFKRLMMALTRPEECHELKKFDLKWMDGPFLLNQILFLSVLLNQYLFTGYVYSTQTMVAWRATISILDALTLTNIVLLHCLPNLLPPSLRSQTAVLMREYWLEHICWTGYPTRKAKCYDLALKCLLKASFWAWGSVQFMIRWENKLITGLIHWWVHTWKS